MARGIQPTAEQLAEERAMTLQAATGELVSWDRYERELLTHLERRIVDQKLLAIVARLNRGNAVEDADHLELFDAVREGAS